MTQKYVIVLDCGATNVRAIAVSEKGKLVAQHSLPNNTQPDPTEKGCLIWDVQEIWGKFKICLQKILPQLDKSLMAGITVTTFGVDGAPFKSDGTMLYPVISWQCGRTNSAMENIDKYISLPELYKLNGAHPFTFNTINKLIWLRENKPEILETSDYFLFISNIFLYYLTGEMVTDASMAGTSMLTDIGSRSFSDKILSSIHVNKSLFPKWVEPGEVVGKITSKASADTDLPAGVPVISSGHDTQFAIYGSGAGENIPVLSSGTWEILMVRSKNCQSTQEALKKGITTEYDVFPGLYNMGVQYVASGVLEWFKKMFYGKEIDQADIYDLMVDGAGKIAAGSEGVKIYPSLFPKTGEKVKGTILGLNLYTKREAIYRAALEALSFQLKSSLETLENAGSFTTQSLICVGGGSKNKLWNQIRADVMGVPVKLIDQKETTVLGAALFALAGAGIFNNADEARNVIQYKTETFEPGINQQIYKELYQNFVELQEGLKEVY